MVTGEYILRLMHSRRSALITLAAAGAAPLLAQTSAPPPRTPVFFNPSDYATISKVADLIIPRTETPGAVDADVPFRIDHEVSLDPELQAIFRKGLAALGPDFLTVSEAQQTAILSDMCDAPETPKGVFFQRMKSLTVSWYYRSEEGLVRELGFHGNTFRPNFPGCTHHEHWPEETK